jgi:hypothetical protein
VASLATLITLRWRDRRADRPAGPLRAEPGLEPGT